MWIERDIGELTKRVTKQYPILLLTGVRQAGKTELLRHYFPDFHYISLDLPSEAEQADKEGHDFLNRHPEPLIIDEAQYAPGLFRSLKKRIDDDRSRCSRYILTGSQKFPLMKEVSESLAGRIGMVELEPLSAKEIVAAYNTLTVEDILPRGGYPALYRDRSVDFSVYFRSYVSSYLERDLRSLLKVGNLRDFERFLRACALRSGQLLNRSELARDVGISATTANEWISVLAASNVVYLLEPWFHNASKSVIKSPKLYLNDSGLTCFLCGIQTKDDLLRSPLLGGIWESFVFAEMRKLYASRTGGWDFFFFRDRQKEVDFVMSRGGRFDLYEAKWSTHPGPGDCAGMNEVARELGEENIASRQIICRTPNEYLLDAHSKAINLAELAFRI